MTTFGQTNPGTDWDNLTGDYAQASNYVLGETLTFTRMWMYMDGNGVGSGDQPCKTLIYAADGSGGVPGTLLAVSNEIVVTDGQSAGWIEFTLTSPVELTPATYWLGFIAGTPTNAARRGYATVASSRKYEPDTYSDGPQDPWSTVGEGTDTLQIAIYAETAAVASQILLASADSVDGAWTDQAGGTSLAAAIDETTFSDSDYIRSETSPSNSGGSGSREHKRLT